MAVYDISIPTAKVMKAMTLLWMLSNTQIRQLYYNAWILLKPTSKTTETMFSLLKMMTKNGPDNVSSKQYIWQPQENLHNFVSAPWWPDSGVHASYRGGWHSSDQHNQGGGDFGNCQVRNYEIFFQTNGQEHKKLSFRLRRQKENRKTSMP